LEKNIEELPEEFDDGASEEAQRYTELRQRLFELNERRRQAREKVERYRALKALVKPFERSADVQGNLLGRDGEVGKELERMLVLLARIGGRIEGLDGQGGADVDVDMDGEDEEKKLHSVLDAL
jgi:hypothetical protein